MGTAVVYLEHGLIYNRVKKSGNSSVLFYLRDLLGMALESERSAAGDYRESKRKAIAVGRGLDALSARQLMQAGRFFRFTIFRNPYSRCLSMYLAKQSKHAGGSAKYTEVPGFEDNSPEGFARFVSFLEEGGLHYDKHFWPQCDLLMCPYEQFDHIGQLERLREELDYVFRMVGLGIRTDQVVNQPHAADQRNPMKVKGANARLAEYYTEDLASRVEALYGEDFVAGGYQRGFSGRVR